MQNKISIEKIKFVIYLTLIAKIITNYKLLRFNFTFAENLKMIISSSHISWDTSVKHYIRFGLFENLPLEIQKQISTTNKHRWQNESDDKYLGCEVSKFIKDELELIKRTGESSKAK